MRDSPGQEGSVLCGWRLPLPGGAQVCRLMQRPWGRDGLGLQEDGWIGNVIGTQGRGGTWLRAGQGPGDQRWWPPCGQSSLLF